MDTLAQNLAALRARIDDCMVADRHRLRRRLQELQRRAAKGGVPADRATSLADAVAASAARRARRAAAAPPVEFPDTLPVSARHEEIARAIRDNQVVVVCGETGSGKTTQLPKICLSLGRGIAGLIGHTQPRRLAARSVAARIAGELGGEPGRHVGHKVRFQDTLGPDAYIKLMTDGILLAEMQSDRFLNQYDTLIIDEAHERSLNIDFLLGYLKQLLPKRPDLKLIITSATIEPERFASHFGDAPVVEVSGRTWPVEVRYRPVVTGDDRDRDMHQAIVDAVEETARSGPGDVLVFLSGEREIRETAEALRRRHLRDTEILPLYARLGSGQQDRVFSGHPGRRVVLATNIAETSLTVPGIRYVVDPGFARLSRYSYRTKVQRLPVERISQASAEQRKGRCGRVGPGLCLRLYEEEDFESRPRFTDPEIRRTNLAAVILQMKALRLGDMEAFPFVDPPDRRYVKDGYRLLAELGALDATGKLTRIGRQLARLPVDPRLGRMVIAAGDEGCLAEVLVIAAALSVQDPRERPLEERDAADQAHRVFRHERSDFLSLLRLWVSYHEQSRELSGNQLRKWCRSHFLSWRRIREWREVHHQLHIVARELGLSLNREPADYAPVHRALLAGLLGQVGTRGDERGFLGPRGTRFQLSPASTLSKSPPKWVMAAELVETRRLYAHVAARIEPEWIEQVAGEGLLSRSYAEPHWEAKPARVAAWERVSLYGLPVVPRRKVHYGPLFPEEARQIFIRSALVEGNYRTRAAFFAHNRRLLAEVAALEHKTRRRDLLVDEDTLFAYYDQRIPDGIHQGASFERWLRSQQAEDPRALHLTREQVSRDGAGVPLAEQFPGRLSVDGQEFALSYLFEPGHADDGVTVTVPAALINQLPEQPFDWLVPGLLQERITALMRTLPKSLRRNFVPLPDFAAACLQSLGRPDRPLLEALVGELVRMTGVSVPDEAWDEQRVPPHLRMNFRVVGADGKVLASGRDLSALRSQLEDVGSEAFSRLGPAGFERPGLTRWEVGDLPPTVEFQQGAMRLKGYPVLVDEGETVALRLAESPARAAAAHQAGLRRLLLLYIPRDVKSLRRNLPGISQACLVYATLPAPPPEVPVPPPEAGADRDACEELRRDVVVRAADRAFRIGGEEVRTAGAFEALRRAGTPRLGEAANTVSAITTESLHLYREVAARRAGLRGPSPSLADVDEQLARLVFRRFVAATPPERLEHLPRYLKALGRRLDKMGQAPRKDGDRMAQVRPLWVACWERIGAGGPDALADPGLQSLRWLLEEFRVSLFAQDLGTAEPVSLKRLRQIWEAIPPPT